jgi:hypothetical protein
MSQWPVGISRRSLTRVWRPTRLVSTFVAILLIAVGLGSSRLVVPKAHASAATPTAGQYVPLAPTRVIDTDSSLGHTGQLSPGEDPFNFDFLGVGGVPSSGVSAVVLHVMTLNGVTSPAAESNGYLYVYSDVSGGTTNPTLAEDPHPDADTLANSGEGLDADNTAIVPISSSDGDVSFYDGTHAGGAAVDLIVDVQGYVTDSSNSTAGATYQPLTPTRVLDTRNNTGNHNAQIFPGTPFGFTILGTGSIPNNGTVAAVAFNLGATNPAADKYVAATTVQPTSQNPIPAGAEEVHAYQGGTADQLMVVAPDSTGKIWLSTNDSDGVDVFIDVEGYYLTAAAGGGGDTYVPVTPTQIVNTSVSQPIGITTGSGGAGALGAGQTISGSNAVPITGITDVFGNHVIPASGVGAVVLSLTTYDATAVPAGSTGAGYIAILPDPSSTSPAPAFTSANVDPSVAETDLDFVAPGADGSIDIFNSSAETTNLDIDVEGYFAESSVPGGPQNVAATDSDPSYGPITVSWNAPAVTGASPISGYVITANGEVPGSDGGSTSQITEDVGATVTS